MSNVRWNVVVPEETDKSVRMFIAEQGGGRKGDLSLFIQKAVSTYLFQRAIDQAKADAAGMSETDLDSLVNEALHFARKR